MIVGGYNLHLYCKNFTSDDRTPRQDSACAWVRRAPYRAQYLGDFHGGNERDCKRQAVQRGWRFIEGDVICPECAKEPK